MQVGHGFAAVFAVIDHQAEAFLAGVIETEVAGNFAGGEQQVAEQCLVFAAGFADAGDDFFWDDQDVGRCLRLNVAKREAVIVFVDDVRRDFAGDDFFEKGHRG